MKTDAEFIEAVEKAFGSQKKTDREAVDKVVASLQEKATKDLGNGTYVKGLVNADSQGVTFTLKQPALRRRVSHFVETEVAKPARKKEATPEDQKKVDAKKTVPENKKVNPPENKKDDGSTE